MTTWLKIGTFKHGYLVLWIALTLSTPTLAATEVGPFQSQEDAALFSNQLEEPSQTFKRVDRVPSEYIIVSEKLGPKPGKKLLEDLARKDIDDVVYVRTGEFGGRVSAGIYLRRSPSAERRKRMLRNQGFQFEPLLWKTQEVNQYWVSSENTPSDKLLVSVKQALGYALTISQLTPARETDVSSTVAVEETVTTEIREEIKRAWSGESTDSEAAEISDPIADRLFEHIFDSKSKNAPSNQSDNQARAPVKPTLLTTEKETETSIAMVEAVTVLEKKLSPTSSGQSPKSQPWLFYIGILIAVSILIGIISFFISRGKRTPPALPETQEPIPEQKTVIADLAIAENDIPAEPDIEIPKADAPLLEAELEKNETEAETSSLKGKDALDLISDQVIVAQNRTGITNYVSFDLAALLLTAVNEARSLHHISPIKYRPTSTLPAVFTDAQAIQRMFSIIIQQSVNLDDASHILIQADYQEGRLTISCLNESALLNEAELQQLTEANTAASFRLRTAETLAEGMQGQIRFTSKFGTGTNITLSVGLPLAQNHVTLKESEIRGIAESRMRLIKSRKVTVPAVNAGLDALEAMLSPSTNGPTPELNKTEALTNAITAMSQQLKAVELAEQQAVVILETVLKLAHQNHSRADETAKIHLAQVKKIAAELNHAKPEEQSEPTPRAFPPYGSTDSSREFFTQLKTQIEEIETARAQGDLQALSRVARWTAKYADGLGMTLVATQFRTIGEAIRKGDELRMLEALTTIHMGLARLNTEGIEASKLA
jgi:hypothetical protein